MNAALWYGLIGVMVGWAASQLVIEVVRAWRKGKRKTRAPSPYSCMPSTVAVRRRYPAHPETRRRLLEEQVRRGVLSLRDAGDLMTRGEITVNDYRAVQDALIEKREGRAGVEPTAP